jgi:imidazoleglycerol-phosphate dehydratase
MHDRLASASAKGGIEMQRTGKCERNTKETQITAEINLDGEGRSEISTGIGFFDHMLALFARHGMLDITIKCAGDTYVDGHHSVEDTGIALGLAIKEALGSKESIARFGSATIPMDEALAFAAVDVSGRAYLVYEAPLNGLRCGEYDVQCTEEFFRAVSYNAGITLHIKALYGRNDHHMIEAMFKAFGRALREAAAFDPRVKGIPSTKGLL